MRILCWLFGHRWLWLFNSTDVRVETGELKRRGVWQCVRCMDLKTGEPVE